ncbi:MAG: response regulator [Syntrophobacteraceae bacterium]
MKINILLVDDEEEFSSALAERLTLRGFKVKTASTGEQALSLIARKPPQVVVLDIMMPELNGLDVLKKIKTDRPKIQVILLTGAGSTKEGIDGMHMGAFDYLMKPVPLDDLISKIFEAVETTPK